MIEAIVEMGSEEARLLLPAPVVEGCPGCAMERRKASSKESEERPPPLPARRR